ncbi:kti12, chromatin associated [Bonamia ostreae]|uniref:Kti12, chromatin associated n=1 Tax=Bonamia ostreae TaxID=126728 RepID=A0ABV2AHV7_9EUKA
MPLVILCGLPCAGKTYWANVLVEKLKNVSKNPILLINKEKLSLSADELYRSTISEKNHRSRIRANVERNLNAEKIVIADFLCHIKGLRYELYTRSKEANTTNCVLFCDESVEVCRDRNSAENVYSQKIFCDLAKRFEPPETKSRWESPMFVIKGGKPQFCWEELTDYVLSGKRLRPSFSTHKVL